MNALPDQCYDEIDSRTGRSNNMISAGGMWRCECGCADFQRCLSPLRRAALIVWSYHIASSFHYRHSLEHKNLDTRVWECAFLNSPLTDRTNQTDLHFLSSISKHSQPKGHRQSVGSRVGSRNWFFLFFFRPKGDATRKHLFSTTIILRYITVHKGSRGM